MAGHYGFKSSVLLRRSLGVCDGALICVDIHLPCQDQYFRVAQDLRVTVPPLSHIAEVDHVDVAPNASNEDRRGSSGGDRVYLEAEVHSDIRPFRSRFLQDMRWPVRFTSKRHSVCSALPGGEQTSRGGTSPKSRAKRKRGYPTSTHLYCQCDQCHRRAARLTASDRRCTQRLLLDDTHLPRRGSARGGKHGCVSWVLRTLQRPNVRRYRSSKGKKPRMRNSYHRTAPHQ